MNSLVAFCAECGVERHRQATDQLVFQSPRDPCKCGARTLRVEILLEVTAHVHAEMVADAKEPGQRRWIRRVIGGRRSWFKRDGRWHRIDRSIDRRGNWYDEKITDEVTGQVVHEEHHPLNEATPVDAGHVGDPT